MNSILSTYIPLCNAIVLLLKPLVEVIIHDLKSGTICFIAGDLSKRQVGDPSLLDIHEDTKHPIDDIIYSKLNFDGRLVKSISIPLQEKGQTIALICINCDVSVFSQMQNLSSQFLSTSLQAQPTALFENDWQERLHKAIHQHLNDQGWHFEHLSLPQKKVLTHHLFHLGAFSEKNAADYIAKILDMGRATIFKYLKEFRKNEA